MEEDKKNKAKLGEKISLFLRKKFLIDKTIAILLVAILIVGYISINLWVRELNLTDIDVTKNKIYTLSDASKEAVSKVNDEITIYAYGFEENSNFINFLKQYNKVNNKITYEILTNENNAAQIQQYNLSEGYSVVILESGDSKKIIDASTEFTTYDYTTYETIDVTEQVMTNSILSLTAENKPKIYLLEGHKEYDFSEMQILSTYLKNEAFETETLNLLTAGSVPEDCDILAIMAPTTDFYEQESDAIINYINNGGNIYFTMDTVFEEKTFPNINKVLDQYGVSIKNGFIVEQENGKMVSPNYPYIFIPDVSSSNDITYDIYSAKTKIILMFASKLEYKDDTTLENLGVSKETLLSSSDNSYYISDVTATDLNIALQNSEMGSSDISALITKNITKTNESGETENKNSQMIIVTCGRFISDYAPKELGGNTPLSYQESNKDFVINGLSYLGKKDNILTIRKDFGSSTYTANENENLVVLLIIFIIPIVVIIFGIVVWRIRKVRK